MHYEMILLNYNAVWYNQSIILRAITTICYIAHYTCDVGSLFSLTMSMKNDKEFVQYWWPALES